MYLNDHFQINNGFSKLLCWASRASGGDDNVEKEEEEGEKKEEDEVTRHRGGERNVAEVGGEVE